LRIKKPPLSGAAAATRPAMQKDHGQPVDRTTLLNMQGVSVADVNPSHQTRLARREKIRQQRLFLKQAITHRNQRQLGGILDIEFLLDVVKVRTDGALTDAEAFGHLTH
jgi:hypothetical protein